METMTVMMQSYERWFTISGDAVVCMFLPSGGR